MAPTRVMPLRLPGSLVDRVEQFAEQNGLNRNQAGRRLIELALSQPDASGYNPRKGAYE